MSSPMAREVVGKFVLLSAFKTPENSPCRRSFLRIVRLIALLSVIRGSEGRQPIDEKTAVIASFLPALLRRFEIDRSSLQDSIGPCLESTLEVVSCSPDIASALTKGGSQLLFRLFSEVLFADFHAMPLIDSKTAAILADSGLDKKMNDVITRLVQLGAT